MNQIKLKICGLQRADDIKVCQELGVDVVGLVTEYPLPVPWNLTAEQAALLLTEVEPPLQSCMVTGGSRDKILHLAQKLRPDYVQLHFQESLADTVYLADALLPMGIGVIKTLPPSSRERWQQFGTADIGECTELLNATNIFAILADTRTAANAAKKGVQADLAFYGEIKARAHKPVILAGGLTPGNIAAVLAKTQPDFIDIMTGVESSPSVKDREKLTQVIQQIR
ncbi:MAG TPA: phosphoribosylanthranilate isomerase [Syntrophomonas sp.]|nr:phosphoribosylanthranilate isomerase [Syntrophomonas sp.]